MPVILNADNGAVSGISGLTTSADNSGVLQFQSSGTATVTITTAGNVGIGTTSPTNLLSVAGNANINGNTTLGDASGDTLTINGNVVSIPNGLTFNSGAVTLSSNPTLSAGTANGVLYLNGSKVATSGSALTFDGSNLGLNVVGGAAINNSTASLFIQAPLSAGNSVIFRDISTGSYAEYMRLTSTGLGIGTSSPSYRLQSAGGTSALGLSNSSNAGVYAYWTRPNKSYILALDINNNGGNDFTLYDNTAGASRLTIDTSGNLGLGVTPSAWNSSYKAFQFGSGSIATVTTGEATYLHNAFINSGGNYAYVNTAAAARYSQAGGVHYWFNAPSGTAGNAITFTQAMTLTSGGVLQVGTTQTVGTGNFAMIGAMNGNSPGTLRVGSSDQNHAAIALTNWTGSTANNGTRIAFDNSGRGGFEIGASSGSNNFDICRTWGTPDLRIDSFGNLIVPSIYNSTTGAGVNVHVGGDGRLYRSTSSLKYKTDVQDATHGLAEVLQLRSVTYKGNSESDGDTVFGGLIAEEVDAIGLTEFVQYAEDGSPDALAYGNMVSLAFKAIQEQQAIINDLKAEVEALKARG